MRTNFSEHSLFQTSRKATKDSYPFASLCSKESESYLPDLEHVFSTAIVSLVASPIFIIVRRVNLPSSVLAQTVCQCFYQSHSFYQNLGSRTGRISRGKNFPKVSPFPRGVFSRSLHFTQVNLKYRVLDSSLLVWFVGPLSWAGSCSCSQVVQRVLIDIYLLNRLRLFSICTSLIKELLTVHSHR